MKIVINTCFGGFGISRKATKRLAELQGRACYFFENASNGRYRAIADGEDVFIWIAFDVPNPNEVLYNRAWHSLSDAEKETVNALYDVHKIEANDRADSLLIKVVEELGAEANGKYTELKIVEIPDGVDWEIDDYDGRETIHEKHRSWS